MRAVVLGLANRAILEEDGHFFSYCPDLDIAPVPCKSWEVSRLLTVSGRRRYLEQASLDDVKRGLRELSRQEAALNLFLMLFDGDCDEDLRLKAVAELESLLIDKTTFVGLEGVVYALPMPKEADLAQARNIIRNLTPHVRALLEPLLAAQDHIIRVRAAWVQACGQISDNAEWCSRALALAHEHAMFPLLVRAVGDATLWPKTLFKLHALNLPGFRPLINDWTQILKASGSFPKKRAAALPVKSAKSGTPYPFSL